MAEKKVKQRGKSREEIEFIVMSMRIAASDYSLIKHTSGTIQGPTSQTVYPPRGDVKVTIAIHAPTSRETHRMERM